jgi:hypothetical protein
MPSRSARMVGRSARSQRQDRYGPTAERPDAEAPSLPGRPGVARRFTDSHALKQHGGATPAIAVDARPGGRLLLPGSAVRAALQLE